MSQERSKISDAVERSEKKTDPIDVPVSPTVRGAIERGMKKGSIPAIELAIETLRYHTEYGGGRSTAKRKQLESYLSAANDLKQFNVLSSIEWLHEVSLLINLKKLKEIHGKQFLIGLCMLDTPLKELFIADGFLDAIIQELKEDLPDTLSPNGLVKYKESLTGPIDEVDDYLQSSDDNPITSKKEDLLDRAAFADFIVKLLNQTSLQKGAFSMHLYAPWGAGKTSFMNFMKDGLRAGQLENGKPQWYIVDFNAWQNQNIAYPWWNFMNNLYSQIKPKLNSTYRFREWFWRFKAQRLHQTVALIVICVLLYFISGQHLDSATWMEPLEKILSAIAGIWAIVISVSQNFINNSQKAAQNYLDNKDNPMSDYKDKFNQLVQSISPARIAIFIDDLDRCKSSYVVELLENIQTLFKESNVLFVIAADITWLYASYEVEYDKIKSFVKVDGKSIGPLFIEKMFQLTVALPGTPRTIKERSWAAMLGIKNEENSPQSDSKADSDKSNNTGTPNVIEVKSEEQQFAANHAERLFRLKSLTDQKTIMSTQHFLRQYFVLLNLNPRNMKRLLNSYLITKAASLISHIDIPKEQMVLYSIIYIQWPTLADYLTKNPTTVELQDHDIKEEIGELLSRTDVRTVIEGKGLGGPLTAATLAQCDLLLNG